MSLKLQLLALFGLGSLVMRGAGCTINDMWDRNIDRQVATTVARCCVEHFSLLFNNNIIFL